MKTEALKQALSRYGFDAAFGGARRDEEKSRAKERVFSFRDSQHRWDPKNQRPELWNVYNGKVNRGESIRVFPLSNWTELDVWMYIHRERIPVVPLYFAALRPVVERDGLLIMVDDDRIATSPGEVPQQRVVRFRTLGLLPPYGCGRVNRYRPGGNHCRDAPESYVGAPGARDRCGPVRRDGKAQARRLFLGARMSAVSVREFIARNERKSLLRFITCGSVDDGKSTLIGRLLHDSQKILEDQMAAIRADSERWGTTGAEVDLALLVDGLQAEREQGITIDVAYRYFDTDQRKFIIADCPGHEQYTRNMATGASTADLAVILIDASKGVLTQTRRHSFIVSLLGIRHVVVAVNKMDLVQYSEDVFVRIKEECERFYGRLKVPHVHFVPVSALKGDNVVARTEAMPWYEGPCLLEVLENVDVTPRESASLRFPVQYVNRPHADFRGYAGTLAGGSVRVGDQVMALPSRRMSTIRSIVTYDGEIESAGTGESVTLTLADEIDVSRGNVLVHPDRSPSVGTQFDAHLIWMTDAPLLPGKQYDIKISNHYVRGTIAQIEKRIDVNDLTEHAADELQLNEIGLCRVVLAEPIAFDLYETCKGTGAFIVIDRISHATAGAGMIRRSAAIQSASKGADVFWQPHKVTRPQRSNQKAQQPCILWFTGLSGAGKSTIANALEYTLFLKGHHSYLLDGDNIRHGLNKDLDFSDAGRVENIRRIGEVAKLFVDSGLIVITAFISPFRSDRRLVRELVGQGEFVEVFVSTPIEECEKRDPKGLYKRARGGMIANFTGINSPYEAPEDPEIQLDTSKLSIAESVEEIVRYLESTERLKS